MEIQLDTWQYRILHQSHPNTPLARRPRSKQIQGPLPLTLLAKPPRQICFIRLWFHSHPSVDSFFVHKARHRCYCHKCGHGIKHNREGFPTDVIPSAVFILKNPSASKHRRACIDKYFGFVSFEMSTSAFLVQIQPSGYPYRRFLSSL